jgi:stromal membrane-associated protein
VVQEKAKIERSTSQRAAASGSAGASRVVRQTQNVDLFGDDPISAPARPSTGPPANKAPPPPKAKVPKQTQPADSLLGLDFLAGPTAAPPARPSSNPTVSGNAPSRPDLKQSILSLYASKPAAPAQPQHVPTNSGSFGGTQAPPASSAFGGMNDAFSSLNFSSSAQQPPKPSPFAGLDSGVKSPRAAAALPKPQASSFAGGGSFFDTPASPPLHAKPAQTTRQPSLGGFNGFRSPAPLAKSPPPPTQSNDLFDLMGGDPTPVPAPIAQPAAPTSSYSNSAFNLSKPAHASQPAAPAQTTAKSPSINLSSNFDGWGSTNAWNDTQPTTSTSTATATASSDMGWGSSSGGFGQSKATPQVSGDEDFGEWGHASPVATTTIQAPPKPASGFNSNNDDLFSNVWQ